MKIIKFNPKKEIIRQKTIEFLQDIIADLELNNLDPEKCLLLCKWKVNDDLEQYQYYHNDLPTETLLGLLELSKDKILDDIK